MKESHFEVVVIGAGMFGSAAAKYLSEDVKKNLLIGTDEPLTQNDYRIQTSFGAYYDQARITRRLGWDPIWSETDSRSLLRYRSIEEKSGITFFDEMGSLVVMAKSITNRTESILRQCQKKEIVVERLNLQQMKDRWPCLKIPPLNGGVEGLYEDQLAGIINPRKFIQAQRMLFIKNGGAFVKGSVSKVEKDLSSGFWQINVWEDGKLNRFYAERVLIAAGSFINHNLVLPDGIQLELYPYTEPNLLFEIQDKDLINYENLPTMISVDPDDVGNENVSIYLVPPIKYPDGKWYIRLGPGMQPVVRQLKSLEDMRQWYIQQKITEEQKDFLLKMQQAFLPFLQPVSIKEACCIIEKTPSHYPYIGAINDDLTLQVVTGGNGHGARGSDEIGRLAARELLEKKWDLCIEKECFTPKVKNKDAHFEMYAAKPPFGLC